MKDQFTREGIVLENALAFWIERLHQAARAEMYRSFRAETGEEITPEQWLVIVRVAADDGIGQTELGALAHRDRPTMSRILSGMERRGLVRRARSATDPRTHEVHLTPRGRRTYERLLPVARALVAKLEHGVPVRDLETTRRTLRRLFENLGSPEP